MLSFHILMRDWLQENFPKYKAGHNYEVVGIFLPTTTDGSQWRYGGGHWVASMRLDGTKISMWHGNPETINMYRFNITDNDVFTKMKVILERAEPRPTVLWLWEPIY